eukprot:8887259-Pyramimonas_sp.AAC.1
MSSLNSTHMDEPPPADLHDVHRHHELCRIHPGRHDRAHVDELFRDLGEMARCMMAASGFPARPGHSPTDMRTGCAT